MEVKQVTPRQETALLGGMGSCGRPLCVHLAHLTSRVSLAFRHAAESCFEHEQAVGQCGKLKCCLNYELDSYMEAMKDIPNLKRLGNEPGTATLQKTDIFQKIMWFTYPNEIKWQPITTKRASDIVAMNGQGTKPFSLFKDENDPTGGVKPKTRLDLLDENTTRRQTPPKHPIPLNARRFRLRAFAFSRCSQSLPSFLRWSGIHTRSSRAER